jgi:hypothetical protein
MSWWLAFALWAGMVLLMGFVVVSRWPHWAQILVPNPGWTGHLMKGGA